MYIACSAVAHAHAKKTPVNVGIPINLLHKKTKKAATSKLVASSGMKFTRSGLQRV